MLVRAPGRWAAALAGRLRKAAAAWQELGERYEQAWSEDGHVRAAGLDILKDLGATATVARLLAR
jgi:hypothetical protein